MNITDPWRRTTLKVSILVLMVVVIVAFFPHKEAAFPYHYEEGRIWKYGLLQAKYDFPIYKGEAQLQEEMAAMDSACIFYFTTAPAVAAAQQKAISEVLDGPHKAAVNALVKRAYAKGLLSSEGWHGHDASTQKIAVSDAQHRVTERPIADCYTQDQLLAEMAQMVDAELLPELQELLLPNLLFDQEMTDAILQEQKNNIPLTIGYVQKDEKIIDRGETIDAMTFLKLESLKRVMNEQGIDLQRAAWSMLGTVVLIVFFVGLVALYLFIFRRTYFDSLRALMFFSALMLGVIMASCLVARYTALSLYIVPLAWVPVITGVFYDSRTAFFLHLITTLICALLSPVPFEFLVLQIAVGIVVVTSLKDISQRSQLAKTSVYVLITYSLCYTAFLLCEKGSLDAIHWHMYIYFFVNALLVLFAYGFIYLFERVFGLVSSITLVELTNINSNLMLEFAEKAPGTFQHSLQVSNLAMEAAKKIGANVLLVRAGALYHDIGKMKSPENYTENQQGGANPLMQMSTITAAQAVISHVTNGVEIAEQHDLPEVIIQFIRSHHGTSKTRFFYNTYVNEHPNEEVDEKLFKYPGPRPSTKEMAVLMMADAVEARSRSLKEYTPESISEMVEQMVGAQLAEGQFELTPLTFADVHQIKRVFTAKLISMNHSRIAYPTINNK